MLSGMATGLESGPYKTPWPKSFDEDLIPAPLPFQAITDPLVSPLPDPTDNVDEYAQTRPHVPTNFSQKAPCLEV